mmetsp:Transcript_72654/g.187411  ORF Transcript_72654/g.187411 Transcript_72654/m.187411 type:complete len:266 (+) Transcript_72654:2373-3170(+)
MIPHAEVLTPALLEVLQRSVWLVLRIVDAGQEQVRVRAGRVQPQALVQDARRRVDLVQRDLRFGEEHLRGHQARHEAGQRLQHLDAAQQVTSRLRALGSRCADSVLQVLPRDLKHEVRVQLNEEVIAGSSLEGGDVQRQCFVEEVERSLDVAPLAPRQERLEEGQVRRLADRDLDLAEELELLLRVVQVPLLHAAVDDAVQSPNICLILRHRLVEGLLSLRQLSLQHLLVAELRQVLGLVGTGVGSPLHHRGRDAQDSLVAPGQA